MFKNETRTRKTFAESSFLLLSAEVVMLVVQESSVILHRNSCTALVFIIRASVVRNRVLFAAFHESLAIEIHALTTATGVRDSDGCCNVDAFDKRLWKVIVVVKAEQVRDLLPLVVFYS